MATVDLIRNVLIYRLGLCVFDGRDLFDCNSMNSCYENLLDLSATKIDATDCPTNKLGKHWATAFTVAHSVRFATIVLLQNFMLSRSTSAQSAKRNSNADDDDDDDDERVKESRRGGGGGGGEDDDDDEDDLFVRGRDIIHKPKKFKENVDSSKSEDESSDDEKNTVHETSDEQSSDEEISDEGYSVGDSADNEVSSDTDTVIVDDDWLKRNNLM
ncbi:transcription initiation factor TFIID subunit 11-like [Anneissia japonica]|uniref:transcription initiation factor TFIID subunit 11-like n=1 Tax=Anneissia japonica TaxID=1529436 RepID=UPI001425B2B7|nr:transcription initiation factor TFIID subunit 11-like [Anneissia japonica]